MMYYGYDSLHTTATVRAPDKKHPQGKRAEALKFEISGKNGTCEDGTQLRIDYDKWYGVVKNITDSTDMFRWKKRLHSEFI